MAFYRWHCTFVLQMWLWILTGLGIITKVHGFSGGNFPEACASMSPVHMITPGQPIPPQDTELPFEVTYQHGKAGEPITGTETTGPFFPESLFITINLCCSGHSPSAKLSLYLSSLLCPSTFALMNLQTTLQFLSGASTNRQSSPDLCWRLERKAMWTKALLLENLSCLTLVLLEL